MYVGDKMEDKFLTIRDINGQIEVDTKFDEYYEDYIFVVIDKEDISTQIANQIIQETDVNFDLEEDYDLVFETIDNALINDIVDTMYHLVENKLKEMLKCK